MYKYIIVFCFSFCSWGLGCGVLTAAEASAAVHRCAWTEQKAGIMALFAQKNYAKVQKQLELLLSRRINKNDRLEMQLLQAYCHFYKKAYEISSDQFHDCVEQYLPFPQVEEAAFMRGYSLACKNVDPRLDQTVTYTAMNYLKQYLAEYPEGYYVSKAVSMLKSLEERLIHKNFNAAYLYFCLGYYRAAVAALSQLDQTYPGHCYKKTVEELLRKSKEKI